MSKPRQQRLGEEIKKEMGDIIRRLKDPRVGFITVTDVEVTRDLQTAKIFVSIMGTEEEKQTNISILKGATGMVRSELARRIRLRQVPEISFHLDTSLEHGARIFQLLQEVSVDDHDSEDKSKKENKS